MLRDTLVCMPVLNPLHVCVSVVYVCVAHLCVCLSVVHAHSGRTFSKNKLGGCRLLGCVAVVFVCWDVKPVFYAIWSPVTWLMGYSDPRKPTDDLLHGQHSCQQLLIIACLLVCP